MFDLIPLTRPRWEMTHLQGQTQVVGQFLQGQLPQPRTIAVAASAIRRDKQFACPGETRSAESFPPALNRSCSKLGCVAVDANADPALIVGQVVHAIGNNLAEVRILKVMDADFLGFSLRPPFLARILEISDQFLLFRVDRHDRLTTLLQPTYLLTDILELGVAVGVIRALARLAVRLQAVTKITQHAGHRARTDRMLLPRQFVGQAARALTGPTQGSVGITTSRWFHQRVKRCPQTGIVMVERLAASARSTKARTQLCVVADGFDFGYASRDSRPRQAGSPSNTAHATPRQLTRFTGSPMPPHAFIHNRRQRLKLPSNPFDYTCVVHAAAMTYSGLCRKRNLTSLFL